MFKGEPGIPMLLFDVGLKVMNLGFRKTVYQHVTKLLGVFLMLVKTSSFGRCLSHVVSFNGPLIKVPWVLSPRLCFEVSLRLFLF